MCVIHAGKKNDNMHKKTQTKLTQLNGKESLQAKRNLESLEEIESISPTE